MKTKDFTKRLETSMNKLNDFAFYAKEKSKVYNEKTNQYDDVELTKVQKRTIAAKKHETSLLSLSQRLKQSLQHYDNDAYFKSFLHDIGYTTKKSVTDLLTYKNYIQMLNKVQINYKDNNNIIDRKVDYLFFTITKVTINDIVNDDDVVVGQQSNLLTGLYSAYKDSEYIESIELSLSFADSLKYKIYNNDDNGIIFKLRKDFNKDSADLYTIIVHDTFNFNSLYSFIDKYVTAKNSFNGQLERLTARLSKKYGYHQPTLKSDFIDAYRNDDILFIDTVKEYEKSGQRLFDYYKNKDNNITKRQIIDLFTEYSETKKILSVDLFLNGLKNDNDIVVDEDKETAQNNNK